MKSKFFVIAAATAIALLIGTRAFALYPDVSIDRDLSRDASTDIHLETTPVIADFHLSPCDVHPEICAPRIPVSVPLDSDPDSDYDGVIDTSDDCADTPADTPVDERGCTDSDSDGFADTVDECVSDAAPDSEGGCPEGVCPDGESCMTGGGDDSSADDGSRLPIIGGALGDDDTTDAPDTDTGVNSLEDYTAGGCSLVHNASSSNVISALVLAISLLPIGIRRKIK